MRKQTEIVNTVRELYITASKECTKCTVNTNNELYNALLSKDTNRVVDTVSELQATIETLIKGVFVNGVSFPAFISKLVVKGQDVEVNIRTRLKADYKVLKKTSIRISEDFAARLIQFYLDTLTCIYYIEIAKENLAVLNEILATAMQEAGIAYKLQFNIDADATTLIHSITDTELILNASISEAIRLSEYSICQAGDEYFELVATNAKNELIENIKTCGSTVQLLKSNNMFIKELTGISTKKRANTLIRETYHKNADTLENLAIGKRAIGYIEKVVDGIEIFSLIERKEDGTKEVILTPFNTATYENVRVAII